MNYLNALLQQARDLILAMPPSSRLMAGLLAAAIVVGSGFLVTGTTTVKLVPLFAGHNFTDSELKMAELAFGKHKLQGWEPRGTRIFVPASKLGEFLKAMGEEKAFPADLGSAVTDALNGNSFFESLMVTSNRLQDAKTNEIGKTLSRLPNVDWARVVYSSEEKGFGRDRQKAAAVFVMPRKGSLTEQQRQGIIKQVQHSFAGLKGDDISLMDLGTDGATTAGTSNPQDAEQQLYAARKHQEEENIKKKAIEILRDYGDVRVAVNVELETTLRQATETRKLDPKAVTVQSQESKKDSETPRPSQGGRPPSAPETQANRGQSIANNSESPAKSKETTSSEQKITGQERTFTQSVGLKPKDASITVRYPVSYFKIAWANKFQLENPKKALSEAVPMSETDVEDMKGKISKTIQESLVGLLPPVAAGVNPLPRVFVDTYIDTAPAPIAGPSLAQTAVAWLFDSWKTLALLGVVVIALLSLRSFAKSAPKSDDREFARGFGIHIDPNLADGESASSQDKEDINDDGIDGAVVANREHRFQVSGSEIKEDLSSIVRANPDAAVNLIRTWIGDAA